MNVKAYVNNQQTGFTIVELLIVIVVIGILAAISIVAYNSVQNQASSATLQSDLRNASTQLEMRKVEGGVYPTPALSGDIKASSGTTLEYTSDGNSYCLSAFANRDNVPAYSVSSSTGVAIQEITSANCSTTRIRTVDARDNRTYWVQKLADGKCWMLTSLAYAGGGTNTYGDTKTLTNGTGGSSTYTTPSYYIPAGAYPTNEPTSPSTSATGIGQYGYLYNWCGAMGGQTTSVCTSVATPTPNTSISVCPAGWRLPTGNGGEFGALNTAVNSGATNTDTGLRSVWLGQRSAYWAGSFGSQGNEGSYWSSSQSTADLAFRLSFSVSNVNPVRTDGKAVGLAVRCISN